MRTGKLECPRRWKSGESVLFSGDLPYESDEDSCRTFSGGGGGGVGGGGGGGGGGVLRCLNPIWSYTYWCAYMHFQNSQGGRSWKAPFSTVARVASRRNHVHCHVHQDTHSCPLHTLKRKEKQIKVCNDWVTKSKTEKKINKQSWNKGTFFPSFLITCLSMETCSIPGAFL